MSVYRHKILQYITDRPNQVVTKDELVRHGYAPNQVTAAVLSIQKSSPIGPEIQTIVQGNAWRYVPAVPTVNNGASPSANLRTPLTTLLHDYFTSHPGVITSIETLMQLTGRTEAQVRVGVNNMLQGRPHMKQHLQKVVNGQVWRYVGPRGDANVAPTGRVDRPAVPVASITSDVTSSPSPVLPLPLDALIEDDDEEDGAADLFERVGRLPDGRIIIKDDVGNLYHATPLRK